MALLEWKHISYFSPDSKDQQGDAILFKQNGMFGLVDAGGAVSQTKSDNLGTKDPVTPEDVFDANSDLLTRLRTYGVNDTNLQWFFQTHFHSDHAWLTADILREFKPKYFYAQDPYDAQFGYVLPSVEKKHQANIFYGTTTFISRIKSAVAEIGAVWITPTEKGIITLGGGDAAFEVLNTNGIRDPEALNDYNCASMVLLVKHGSKKMLFMGDSKPHTMYNHVANYIGKVDYVATAHHGYVANLTFEMANILKPNIVVGTKWKDYERYQANHTGLYQLINAATKIYNFHPNTNYNLEFYSDGATVALATTEGFTTRMIWKNTWCDATRLNDGKTSATRWYWFDGNGNRKSGWQQDASGTWYYFEPNSSWVSPSGKAYYFGQMYYSESVLINGKVYNFAANGACTNP